MSRIAALIALLFLATGLQPSPALGADPGRGLEEHLAFFASLGDRSLGSPGAARAADYVEERFKALGYQTGRQHFIMPVMRHRKASLTMSGTAAGREIPLRAFLLSEATPASETRDAQGPVVWAGGGELRELDGKPVEGAVVLMDMDSGERWRNAAMLGARALVYIDRGDSRGGTARDVFEEKLEVNPLTFPRFWMTEAEAREAFGDYRALDGTRTGRLSSDGRWRRAGADNIWCLVPGTDPALAGELMIVESFYDSSAFVAGLSPGAGEAASVSQLLVLAERLAAEPPGRPVLLAATAGHAESLTGMRELVWAMTTSAKELRSEEKDLRKLQDQIAKSLEVLTPEAVDRPELWEGLQAGLETSLKDEVDRLSLALSRLRLEGGPDGKDVRDRIRELAAERLMLRRLGWRSDYANLAAAEREKLLALIPKARERLDSDLADASDQAKALRSARALREAAQGEVAAFVSLHLSSRGSGVGPIGDGWLYRLADDSARAPFHSAMSRVLTAVAGRTAGEGMYQDTLRPSSISHWRSHFGDKPQLGGEVSALAGLPGFTMVTLDDSRFLWGTPYDTMEALGPGDREFLARQSAFLTTFLPALSREPALRTGAVPRNGFSVLTGRARFIRQGEVFPDMPAPGAVVQAYQGSAVLHAMADETGVFRLKGMADKKHVLDKVILEAWKFDPATGEAKWAIDRNRTNRNAVRVRMNRQRMETDLVMFDCDQMTVFGLIEPRSFRNLVKIEVLDGAREAQPLRYSFARADTGLTDVASVFAPAGIPLKLTFSDTVLGRKMLLLNSTPDDPDGTGYRPEERPSLTATEYLAARDMWGLIIPRLESLERHGIVNELLRSMRQQGVEALARAETARQELRWSSFLDEARRSWSLAINVYADVESTRRDVLMGVLFYIAMFVPFAFVLERLVFGYPDIHRRILAFLGILGATIALIWMVHPAFQLIYSPAVVVLAFFIVGLSVMVSLIVFFRFEREMAGLQRRARHVQAAEISSGKAFAAAFSLGVGNLRRRRIRTGLTSATLIILTFTIMSFTTVKSLRQQGVTALVGQASYRGLLVRNIGWTSLSRPALDRLRNTFEGRGLVSPRVWLESEDRSQGPRVVLRSGDRGRAAEAGGLVGLGSDEPAVTGLDRALIAGRWFTAGEGEVAVLPLRLARELGLPEGDPAGAEVQLWGRPFRIVGVFDPGRYQALPDLDGEAVTPVIFPSEAAAKLTEADVEAAESGEEATVVQGRYQHIPAESVVLVPAGTLLAMGGNLKAVAVAPAGDKPEEAAAALSDRLALSVFSGGPDGTFLHHAADALSYSGMPNIVVPLVISALIVLNTMIGSVYERKREIAVYTSVGLAPIHVSFLFIAEALAFAVMSTVLGYLLAQGSVWLLSGTSLFAGMTANYSSLAGVAAMVLVILVVMVSVLYPSKIAADIAIPDVNRSWTLPEPEGDAMETTLPFLVRFQEQRCVAGFLCDYYGAHKDVSHGLFSTGWTEAGEACPVGVPSAAAGCLFFCALVWLAPFDFGIKQRVRLEFCQAAEEPSFLEIKVRIEREAGEAGAWKRMNKAFLNDLRKQLLVWRSLDPVGREAYADKLVMGRQA